MTKKEQEQVLDTASNLVYNLYMDIKTLYYALQHEKSEENLSLHNMKRIYKNIENLNNIFNDNCF